MLQTEAEAEAEANRFTSRDLESVNVVERFADNCYCFPLVIRIFKSRDEIGG